MISRTEKVLTNQELANIYAWLKPAGAGGQHLPPAQMLIDPFVRIRPSEL